MRIELRAAVRAYLDDLAGTGAFGDTAETVALTLIERGVQDALTARIIAARHPAEDGPQQNAEGIAAAADGQPAGGAQPTATATGSDGDGRTEAQRARDEKSRDRLNARNSEEATASNLAVLEAIRQIGPRISTADIAARTGLAQETARRAIKRLEKAGQLRAEGWARGRRYYIVGEPAEREVGEEPDQEPETAQDPVESAADIAAEVDPSAAAARPPRTWLPDSVETLTALVKEGLTAGQIANRMGQSRNAVIGKARALGLRLATPAVGGVKRRTRATGTGAAAAAAHGSTGEAGSAKGRSPEESRRRPPHIATRDILKPAAPERDAEKSQIDAWLAKNGGSGRRFQAGTLLSQLQDAFESAGMRIEYSPNARLARTPYIVETKPGRKSRISTADAIKRADAIRAQHGLEPIEPPSQGVAA